MYQAEGNLHKETAWYEDVIIIHNIEWLDNEVGLITSLESELWRAPSPRTLEKHIF